MKYIITIIITIAIFKGALFGQDNHYSQFYASPSSFNPAMTGLINGHARGVVQYRNQWSSVHTPFKTMSLSADVSLMNDALNDDMLGLGVQVASDRVGAAGYKVNSLGMTMAYQKEMFVEGSYIGVGFRLDAAQQSLDADMLRFDSQYDGNTLNPLISSGEDLTGRNTYFDFSAGISWSYSVAKMRSYFVGASISHLNQPSISLLGNEEERLYRRLTLYAGGELRLSRGISLLPRFVYLQQGPSSEINGGLLVKFVASEEDAVAEYHVQIGTMHRWKDAQIVMLKVNLDDFLLGFSYDFNISKLAKASNTNGAWELSLAYTIPRNHSPRRGVYCPSF